MRRYLHMDDSNIQDTEFWRQLELLSLQLISSKLNGEVKIGKSYLTQKRKDGGFDGEITINILNDAEICHKVLFESKFRTSIKSLPLNDCAKALIIAFNQAAQTLYIVTNVLFSPQAQKEIDKFKNKINLTVMMVDGKSLKNYVNENREALLKVCSEDFLQYIESSSDIDIDIKINDLSEKTTEKITTTEIKKRNNLRTDNLEISSKEYLYKNSFFKAESKKFIDNIKTISKYTLLLGEAGIGKTVFLTETFHELKLQKYSTAIFDLQQYETPRILFIKFLESLWEFDLSAFISQIDYEDNVENLKSLIEYNSDGKISENLLSAVTQAVCKHTEKIKGYTDNYYYLLANYIYLLLKPYSETNKIVWAFTDLNKANLETLDFLYTFLCKIKGIISIIVEMRPGFIPETISSELVQCDYYTKFKSISNTPYTIELAKFDYSEAKQYVKEYLPNTPEEQLNFIIDNVGTLPLYLNTATNYIRTQIQNRLIDSAAIPNRILKNWLSQCEKNGKVIILNSLRYFQQNPDINFCFCIAGLLDGRLPIAIIEAIYTLEQQTVLSNYLDTISFYKFKGDSYYIKHDCIFDTIKDSMSERLRYTTAKKIYECVQNPNIPFDVSDEKLFELLYFMQEYEIALDKWFHFEKELYKEHLFWSIITNGNIALKCYDNLELKQRKQDIQIKIITSILNAYLQIRILNTEEFHQLLLQYETICNLKQYSSEGAILKARYLFYKWNQFFYGADIGKSYGVILEAKTIVDEKNIDDIVLCSNIYWAYALSHKRKTTIQQAIEDYKDGLKKYPNSTILNVGLKLHQAHTYLRKYPQKSCEICESILDDLKTDDCPYHEILQIRIDIVMSQFYAGLYIPTLENCEEVLQIASSVNASYQMGRLYNIFAAGLLMLGNTNDAEAYLLRAYHEFQESGNHLFAWRADFNLAQVLLRLGRKREANEKFKALYNGQIPNLKERAQNLTLENAEMVAFLYTVRFLKEKRLYKENETAKLLQSNKIFVKMSCCDTETFLEELQQLSYIHKDYLVILG